MQYIYMDQAATSFPKAPRVAEEMSRYLTEIGANIGRGSYPSATEAALAALSLREQLRAFFHAEAPECCILTSGSTFGLNMVLQGFLHSGDTVVVSSLEHNAVMRPLQLLNARVRIAPCQSDGSLAMEAFERMLTPEVCLLCMTHASNVSGTILPIAEVGAICHARGVPLVVDAAQTAGHEPIDCQAMHIDALIVPGHKGLLGPQGIGAAILSRSFAQRLRPWMAGGTGSHSADALSPSELPDKFEAGTLNLPGIYGLSAALDYVAANRATLQSNAQALTKQFLHGVSSLEGVRVLGLGWPREAVVSLDFPQRDNALVADCLAREFGICTRCGLHCAPNAHRALGSFPQGAVRFSFGYGNTEAEVAMAVNALATILSER